MFVKEFAEAHVVSLSLGLRKVKIKANVLFCLQLLDPFKLISLLLLQSFTITDHKILCYDPFLSLIQVQQV